MARRFSRGALVGIGVVGSMIIFQSGWTLAATAKLIEDYFHQTMSIIKAAQQSDAALARVHVDTPADVWGLYFAGFVGMAAGLLMMLESCLDMKGEGGEKEGGGGGGGGGGPRTGGLSGGGGGLNNPHAADNV